MPKCKPSETSTTFRCALDDDTQAMATVSEQDARGALPGLSARGLDLDLDLGHEDCLVDSTPRRVSYPY